MIDKTDLKFSICVSGASSGDTVAMDKEKAKEVGRAIARSGHVITTGATIGLPYYAALGAASEDGMSIGFSPAISLREHIHKYRLPSTCFTFINFTGLHYVGRDLYLVQSSDAIITIGGRFGSMHEFTSALEAHKPCGVLTNSGGAADEIKRLMEVLSPPHNSLVIYDDDPDRLVSKIVKVLEEKNADLHGEALKCDNEWFLDEDSPKSRAG